MKLFCLITVILLFVTTVPGFSQQFVLEWEISEKLTYVGDIDGDGIGEFVHYDGDNYITTFYDGQNHNVKWTITDKKFDNSDWNADTYIHPTYTKYPSIDYNGDGKREVFFDRLDGTGIIIVDVVNNTNVFELLNSQISSFRFRALSDVDGDGELELVFGANQISGGDKTFVYSTGVQTTAVNERDNNTPSGYILSQNYPNPFNPTTTISYSVPKLSFVAIKVYDVLGNEIAILVNEEKSVGSYEVEFSAKGGSASGRNAWDLPSGIYFYRLQANDFTQIKKMILLK